MKTTFAVSFLENIRRKFTTFFINPMESSDPNYHMIASPHLKISQIVHIMSKEMS